MTVHAFAAGEPADASLRSEAFDLLLLDIGLPDIDGFELLSRLRSRGSTLPVLLLTARDEISDRVHGLNLGADDYVVKPFAVDELMARVRSLLRRHPARSGRLTHGTLVMANNHWICRCASGRCSNSSCAMQEKRSASASGAPVAKPVSRYPRRSAEKGRRAGGRTTLSVGLMQLADEHRSKQMSSRCDL